MDTARGVLLALPVAVVHAADTEITEHGLAIGLELRLRALHRSLVGLDGTGVVGDLIGMELGERCHQRCLIRLQHPLCVLP